MATRIELRYHTEMSEEFIISGSDSGTLAESREIYTVSRLNREVRDLLEGSFPLLWIEAELSNVARPSSGHLYFSLKDATAQVRCAMFRGHNRHLDFIPENGTQVLVHARLSLYEARGDYQLIIEHMEEAGDGALRRAFDLLKRRLANEGLFDPAHKKPLPTLPKRIGVITSPTGAAIHDIVSVLQRRFPALPLLIYPVPVQGDGAAARIAAAIETAARRGDCDVLIVARGGGSLEDLWSFNEEIVARAIHACPLPVVCGVGHEIDFTIADLAADVRAPTPSGAAELIAPDQQQWLHHLRHSSARLQAAMQQRLDAQQQGLRWLTKRLQQNHPGQRLRQQNQRIDELEQRLQRLLLARIKQDRLSLRGLTARLQRNQPLQRICQYQAQQRNMTLRLRRAVNTRLRHTRQQLESLGRALDAVSPLATLGRGYAIITAQDGSVVRTAKAVQHGELINARLGEGMLSCEVKETLNE